MIYGVTTADATDNAAQYMATDSEQEDIDSRMMHPEHQPG